MPTIASKITVKRARSGPADVSVSCDIKFSKAERDLDLQCFIRAAMYDRDHSLDKVFFWTNGNTTNVHSWKQTEKDKGKDDFIAFLPSKNLKPSDSSVTNGVFRYEVELDFDDPRIAGAVNRARDIHNRPGTSLVTDDWEEVRVFVHAYNELAPSTMMADELHMDIN